MKIIMMVLPVLLTMLGANTTFALDRYTGDGDTVDFAMDVVNGDILLYIAKKPTNNPLEDALLKFVPDDEKVKAIEFAPSEHAGIYKAKLPFDKLPEGQVVLVGDEGEGMDAYKTQAGQGHADHDHSHGRTAGKSFPLWVSVVFALFGGILLGAIFMKVLFKKSKSAASAALILVLLSISGFIPLFIGNAYAGEGHSHGEAKISEEPLGSEVSMNKKSQFMIGLRTVAAKVENHNITLETFGHVTAKPSLNAIVTAPRSGFVSGQFDGLWGKKVKKGQILAAIDSVGSISIKSPIAGTVVEVTAVSGMRVEQGTKLFRVVDMSELWIDAEVFQEHLSQISKKESTVAVTIDGEKGHRIAKITGAVSGVDENTLTAKVFLQIENNNENINLGSSVHISFPLTEGNVNGVLLPKEAVLNRGGEKLVFIQTDAELFESRGVAVSRGPTPDVVVVTSGLKPEDRVVVTGNYQLLVGAH